MLGWFHDSGPSCFVLLAPASASLLRSSSTRNIAHALPIGLRDRARRSNTANDGFLSTHGSARKTLSEEDAQRGRARAHGPQTHLARAGRAQRLWRH
jgi:hypothetical protein